MAFPVKFRIELITNVIQPIVWVIVVVLAKVRAMARNFREYLAKNPQLCAQYFILIDIRGITDGTQDTRQEYYDLVTSYTGILYFFSGLMEHLNTSALSKRSLIRLFKHVFEWWYLNSIKNFIIVYQKEFNRLKAVNEQSLPMNQLTSNPPWVENLKRLSEIMHLELLAYLITILTDFYSFR